MLASWCIRHFPAAIRTPFVKVLRRWLMPIRIFGKCPICRLIRAILAVLLKPSSGSIRNLAKPAPHICWKSIIMCGCRAVPRLNFPNWCSKKPTQPARKSPVSVSGNWPAHITSCQQAGLNWSVLSQAAPPVPASQNGSPRQFGIMVKILLYRPLAMARFQHLLTPCVPNLI